MSRTLAALAALLALAANAAANSTYGVFAESEQGFHQLEADPRRIQLAAAHYWRAGEDPAGVEFTSRRVNKSRQYPVRLFAAHDAQFKEATAYGANQRTVAGVSVGFDGVPRSMRFFVGRFDGYSPYGQLYRRRERYHDVGF